MGEAMNLSHWIIRLSAWSQRALDVDGWYWGQSFDGPSDWPTCDLAESPHLQVPRIVNLSLSSLWYHGYLGTGSTL